MFCSRKKHIIHITKVNPLFHNDTQIPLYIPHREQYYIDKKNRWKCLNRSRFIQDKINNMEINSQLIKPNWW